jgi:hypothetical protein
VKLLKTKNTRFAEITAAAGKPEVYIPWRSPESDRHLQGLIKANRIITVLKSDTGTDFGQVGFKAKKGASYLVFPKSLKRFENHRIIGIKWDAISE